MMLLLGDWLISLDAGFGAIQYITLRAIFSALTALLVCLLFGPLLIRWLTAAKIGQSVRDDGPESHFSKAGTPTMGGAMIVVAVALSTLLWSDLGVRQVWFVLFVTVGFAAVGWVDDYRKVMLSNSAGLSAREKLIWQSLVAGVAVVAVYFTSTDQAQLTLTIPIFKDADLFLGWMFIPFAFLVIVRFFVVP